MSPSKVICGVQPVVEALQAGRPLDRIYLARDSGGASRKIRSLAKKAGVPVSAVAKEEIDRRSKGERHQGVVALANANEVATVELEDILDQAEAASEDPLIVLLDGIQDPHNFGAILRSAHALGAHGVVIPKNRAVQVTASVIRASAGAANHIPVTRVVNLKHALDRLEKRGVWTAAAVMDGTPAYGARLSGPLGLVIGGEATGVRPTVAERCDLRVSIPLSRSFDSLNASVAAGVLLYEVMRQRLDNVAA